MPAVIKSVQTYAAFLYPNEGKQRGRINLYCADSYKLYLLFQDPGDPLSPNTFSSNTGVAYQRINQYQNYLDLVRNEKPIWVTFNTDVTPPYFVVYCANEPPGEGEI